jgi:hypothetical protein
MRIERPVFDYTEGERASSRATALLVSLWTERGTTTDIIGSFVRLLDGLSAGHESLVTASRFPVSRQFRTLDTGRREFSEERRDQPDAELGQGNGSSGFPDGTHARARTIGI